MEERTRGFNGIIRDYLLQFPERFLEWDRRSLEAIGESSYLRPFAKVLIGATYFGDGYIWGLAALGLILFGRPIDRQYVLIALGITVINITVFRLLKYIFRRTRPYYVSPLRELRYRRLDSYSFPSGHATTSFSLAFLISCFYPLLPVQLAAYSVSSVISFSRVYVGEHYPSDVISGALLGILLSNLLLPLFERLIL